MSANVRLDVGQSIPAGYVLGRLSGGVGPAQLIPIQQLAGQVANSGLVMPAGASGTSGSTTVVAGTAISVSVSGTAYTVSGAYTAGTGITITGASIANSGVLSLTAPAAGFGVSGSTGAITFTLNHDLAALEALAGTGIAARTAADTWAQRTITGTSARLSVSNGDGVSGNPTLDIDAAYVGQSSITTLGTIGTGTWQGTVITGQFGGTGVANTGKTITLGGNLTTSGAFATTLTVTAATNSTLPAGTHTLAGLDVAQTFTAMPQQWNTGANTNIEIGQYSPNTTFNFLTLNGDLSANGIGLIGGDSTQLGHLFLHIPTSGGQIIDHIGSSNVVTTTSTEVTYAYGASNNLQIGKWAGGTYNMVSFNASFSATAGIGFIGGGGGDSNVYAVVPTGGKLIARVNNVNACALAADGLELFGATSGTINVKAAAVAGTNTITLPAGTTDFSATGGTSQVVKQTSAGGAFTVGQLDVSDLTGAPGTWTPTITANIGTFTSVSAVNVDFMQIGKLVTFHLIISITTNGTANGFVIFTVPAPISDFTNLFGRSGSTGKMLNGVAISSTQVAITFYDGTYPGSNGENLYVSGFYYTT